MRNCTCFYFEDSTGEIDPTCPEHWKDAVRLMGEHRGEGRSFRDAIRPPKTFSRTQRTSWYVGLFVGAVLACAVMGAIVGLAIGLVRWLTLALAWLAGG